MEKVSHYEKLLSSDVTFKTTLELFCRWRLKIFFSIFFFSFQVLNSFSCLWWQKTLLFFIEACIWNLMLNYKINNFYLCLMENPNVRHWAKKKILWMIHILNFLIFCFPINFLRIFFGIILKLLIENIFLLASLCHFIMYAISSFSHTFCTHPIELTFYLTFTCCWVIHRSSLSLFSCIFACDKNILC